MLLAAVAMCTFAAAPNGSGTYYQNANGYKGAALKTALRGIIYNRTEKTYGYLWTAFQTTDVRSDGKIWDMYSNITNYTPVTSGSSYSDEGDCYNREHSFPQSWFNSSAPMYTDLHHIYPTDGKVNGMRGNYPFGETNGETYKSANNFSKLGACTYSGYTGTVFEPNDIYKGDFARTYFYMVTCYEEKLADWYSNYSDSRATLDGKTYPGLKAWQLNMLMEWAKNDPVSEKEINRNNAVYGIQNNRNPFIDYPGLEQYIWGTNTDDFDYDDYVIPEGYGSGGDDPGPGPNPDPSLAGTYKLTITAADFNATSYAGNNNEKTSLAVCTTDASKTYEVKWTSYQVMLQSGAMQWQKNAGYIYNSTDLGTITDVTITSSAGSFTTYYGSSAQPSSSTTVGGGYFKTEVGGETGKTSKVEVTFTIGGGSTPTLSSAWVETSLESLTASDIFVIVGNNGNNYALPNDGGTFKTPAAIAVNVEGGKITSEVANNLKWNVSGNATDGYIFYPNGSSATWLYCNNNNDGVRVGTTNKKLFKLNSGYLQNVGTSRYLGIYNSQDWCCYTSITGNSNIKGQTFAFYKYVASSAPTSIPVFVSELGCGTFASDYALDFSASEIRAFYATVSGNNLIFYEVEKVPANTGVLLYKVGGASDDIPVYNGTTDAVTGNANAFVRGTGAAVSYTDNDKNYILFDGSDGLGFYKANNNPVATNRAYIHVPVSVNVKCFLLDLENDPTGIESIQNSKFKIQNEDAIYNLAGQRLSKMQKGINIINGKKVLR